MKASPKRTLQWAIGVVLLLLLLLQIVRFSSSESEAQTGGNKSGRFASSLTADSGSPKEGRRITSSRRKLAKDEEFDAHVVSVDMGESVIFPASGVGEYDGVLVHPEPRRIVDESGVERVVLTTKLVDATRSAPNDEELSSLMDENSGDRVLDENTRQVMFRKLSQMKGTDIMTTPSQAIERDRTVEFLLCHGREQVLLVKGRLCEEEDGQTKIQFGHLYARPRGEHLDLVEAWGAPEQPE